MRSVEEIKAEIERTQTALAKTQSEYLKRDYTKHIKRLEKELYVRTKRNNQRT